MSFYQQPLLWFLCAAAIPVIIHLLNRRRHKTLQWAAMQFLLKATRESRGKKKLRHILILTARTLGIACLAFAVARPMIGGLLGCGASQLDTVILILDRSPSMEITADNTTASKRALAIDRVRDAMKSLDATRLVLIDSASNTPQDIPSPDSLADITSTRATDAAANIPSLLQRAAEFILETQPGKTEVWIASDMQQADWDKQNERWTTAIATLQSAPQNLLCAFWHWAPPRSRTFPCACFPPIAVPMNCCSISKYSAQAMLRTLSTYRSRLRSMASKPRTRSLFQVKCCVFRNESNSRLSKPRVKDG